MLTLGDVMEFILKCGLIFAGLYAIVVLTPKMAAYIDKKRAQNKSPYESAPVPERVDDACPENDENIASDEDNINTDSNTKE